MTIHRRFTFEKLKGDWQFIALEKIVLGDVIRFYDNGHLAYRQGTSQIEWLVDANMKAFIDKLIIDAETGNTLPEIVAKGIEVVTEDYSYVFKWIMARMQDGNMEALNKLYESYDPSKHSAEYMSGLLRCGYSQRRRLPAWLDALKKVSIVLGAEGKRTLVGMNPAVIEQEMASEPVPDKLGALFDSQILNAYPDLVRK